MIYTPKTKQAIRLCFQAHKDQRDKSGLPYVFHPYHVAEQMEDEITTVVALLHDVVEDTDITFSDLKDMGFSSDAVSALELLTHTEGTPYMEYVEKIKQNPIARAVKLADLEHNSDLSRLEEVNDEDLQRREKYRQAIRILKGE